MSRLTVCIPTYRRNDLLRRTLASVLGQTLQDLEVFVADNAADPATADLVRSFGDERVQHVASESNLGPIGNFNRCLHFGTAPYITIVHDDDLVDPDAFERKVAVLDRHPAVAVVHTALRYIREDDSVVRTRTDWTDLATDTIESGDVFLRRTLQTGNRICLSTAVFRRHVAELLQFDDADGTACDLGFWLRASRLGDVAFLKQPLASMRVHGRSRSADSIYDGESVPTTTLAIIILNRDTKLRYAASLPDPRAARTCRRLARRAARQQLCAWAVGVPRQLTTPPVMLRRMVEAIRTEPSLLWLPQTVAEVIQRVVTVYLRNKAALRQGPPPSTTCADGCGSHPDRK